MERTWTVLSIIVLVIVMAFAGSIGKFFGKSGSEKFFREKKSAEINTLLMEAASELNAQLPVMVDKGTRLDNTVGVNNKFKYNYTMISMNASDIDKTVFQNEFSTTIKNRACTREDMQAFFENGITVEFIYSGKEGKNIGMIAVSPSDCGY